MILEYPQNIKTPIRESLFMIKLNYFLSSSGPKM